MLPYFQNNSNTGSQHVNYPAITDLKSLKQHVKGWQKRCQSASIDPETRINRWGPFIDNLSQAPYEI